ncbi:MAG: hypothetical protein ACE5E8_00675 [Acidimicrobiia bacterium]
MIRLQELRRLAVASQTGAVLLTAAAGTSVQQVQASPVFFTALPGLVARGVSLTVTGTRLLRAAPR